MSNNDNNTKNNENLEKIKRMQQEQQKKQLEDIDTFFNTVKKNSLANRSINKGKDIDKSILSSQNSNSHYDSKSRMDKLAERKPKVKRQESNLMENKNNKKKKKRRFSIKKFILFCFLIMTFIGIGVVGYVASIIMNTEEIDPSNIYDYLNESSVMYDDQGKVINNIFSKDSGVRKNIEYSDLPENVVNAFVALEDKTFFEHNGFNIIRIFGAIKDSLSSGRIGGTSTITQQLARNIYLSDTMHDRNINRKIKEAYYTVIIEKHLTKEQILEAYLNTISLGYNSYGIQAASKAYFNKDVADLDLVESAALAALPQAPFKYSLIKKYNIEDVTDPNDPNVLFQQGDFFYVYNDISTDRRNLCLRLMKDQGKITQEEYDVAIKEDLKSHLSTSPNIDSSVSSYFIDYVMENVIYTIMEETNKTYEEAYELLYSGGLKIYTTMNTDMQSIAEEEFKKPENFPNVASLRKDANGNILNSRGKIILYNLDTYFDKDGGFLLTPDEYTIRDDGSLVIYNGKRLNIFKTKFNGNIDFNLEIKPLYVYDDTAFKSINGGVISIPAQYKTRDDEGNLVISSKIFDDKESPNIFIKQSDGLYVQSTYISLRPETVQPQGAMAITDPYTGHVKALVGGRNTSGRLLFNRATHPKQPGSSIKPIAVYGPALQLSLDTLNSGTTISLKDADGPGGIMGDYLTVATVIDDTPMTHNGKVWPQNWYRGFKGLTTFRESVQQSINVSAVRLLEQVGFANSVAFLKRVGISSIVEEGNTNDLNPSSLALGGMTHGISPLEMSSAYNAFVNDGKYTSPITFTKITNKNDEILLENTPEVTQAMDPGVAFIMRDVLRSVVTGGSGARASVPNQPTCGKTGTTNDNKDYWFVGFTPQYSGAVWIGNDVNVSLNSASLSAAKLWGKIMTKILANVPTGAYHVAPANVTSALVDSKSGQKPSALSSLDPRNTVHTEYFIKGTEPKTEDSLHTTVEICTESGYLATPDCIYTQSISGIRRPYDVNPRVEDLKYEVPHTYCPLHNLDTETYPVNTEQTGNYTFEGHKVEPDPSDEINIDDPANNGIDNNENNPDNNSTPDDNQNNGENQEPQDKMPDWL